MPTMKAWQASAYGAEGNPADTIANLKLADVEIPSAGAGQIQVKVSHAALNERVDERVSSFIRLVFF